MAELKTKPTNESVEKYLKGIPDPVKRQDSITVVKLMTEITGQKPKMWGASIVGFGRHHYKYPSGQEADWPVVGFSPRKQNLTLYVLDGSVEENELLQSLGKHSTGKSCLYIKRLDDVDLPTLKKLIKESYKRNTKKLNK
ncbi:MAG TPA: DUF1801 domain-containing protein [Pyrinomonadaceae bacterium]